MMRQVPTRQASRHCRAGGDERGQQAPHEGPRRPAQLQGPANPGLEERGVAAARPQPSLLRHHLQWFRRVCPRHALSPLSSGFAKLVLTYFWSGKRKKSALDAPKVRFFGIIRSVKRGLEMIGRQNELKVLKKALVSQLQ